ncbi:MAG: nucleotide exchange factor GrpE [Planctomycetota bacterium]|nr:nucleotide exchange factor GrpE [Planctomycetota bacterium]
MNAMFGKDKKRRKEAQGEAPAAPEVDTETVDEETATETLQVGEAIEPAAPVEEWKEKYVRVLAELDNFRKRTDRDRETSRKYACEDLMRALLPVLDALNHATDAEGDGDAIRDGVRLALHDMLRILGEKGMVEIAAIGEPFDPHVHEAIGMIPSHDHAPGTVVLELARGYTVHERVLRPSRVQIAGKPPEPPAEPASDAEGAAAKD